MEACEEKGLENVFVCLWGLKQTVALIYLGEVSPRHCFYLSQGGKSRRVDSKQVNVPETTSVYT